MQSTSPRGPSRTRLVGAGFDHHSLTAGPAQVESELIAPDSETSILSQNHRKPRSGRASSEAACPTGFPRQVKSGRVGGARKGGLRDTRSIASEVKRLEIRAARESELPDDLCPAGNRH